MKTFYLSAAVFAMSVVLCGVAFGQDATPATTSIDVYLKALRELGSFGALLWFGYRMETRGEALMKQIAEETQHNTEAIQALNAYIRDHAAK